MFFHRIHYYIKIVVSKLRQKFDNEILKHVSFKGVLDQLSIFAPRVKYKKI